jgi:hypothetical protein
MKTRLLKKLRKQAKRAIIACVDVWFDRKIMYTITYSGKSNEGYALNALRQFNAPRSTKYIESLPVLYECLSDVR